MMSLALTRPKPCDDNLLPLRKCRDSIFVLCDVSSTVSEASEKEIETIRLATTLPTASLFLFQYTVHISRRSAATKQINIFLLIHQTDQLHISTQSDLVGWPMCAGWLLILIYDRFSVALIPYINLKHCTEILSFSLRIVIFN